jgi:hypothetical protein
MGMTKKLNAAIANDCLFLTAEIAAGKDIVKTLSAVKRAKQPANKNGSKNRRTKTTLKAL